MALSDCVPSWKRALPGNQGPDPAEFNVTETECANPRGGSLRVLVRDTPSPGFLGRLVLFLEPHAGSTGAQHNILSFHLVFIAQLLRLLSHSWDIC